VRRARSSFGRLACDLIAPALRVPLLGQLGQHGVDVGLRALTRNQPVGHRPENPDYMYNSGKNVWAKEFRER
jgi:hypothetical protein